MKSQIFVSIGVLSVAAIGWLVYLDSNRAEVEARQDNVALTGSNASGKPYVAVTQESFVDRIPDPRDKTRTAADIEREFNEEHPLMPSGARGGYGLDRNRKRLESNLGRHLPDELRRKFESLPPDPNDRFRHEIHALRREIRGAIRESASERWRKMIDAVAATGDSNAIEKAFLNTDPHTPTPIEKVVLKALDSENVDDPHYAKYVSDYLRERYEDARHQLDAGNPENPQWLASHMEWIEEAAQKMHLSLDPSDDGFLDDWQAFTDKLWP